MSKKALADALLTFQFPLQNRDNVLENGQKYYRGFVLGRVTSWAHEGGTRGKEKIDSRLTKLKKYQDIHKLAKQCLINHDPTFKFTSIQFNKNHQMKRHKDGKNVGESYIIGFGDYTGGDLMVYNKEGTKYKLVNIKNKFFKFDGSVYPHETAPFKGNRFTLVYYTN